jgi:hypothetical protein
MSGTANSPKFIPNGDMEFKEMAQRFERAIASDPARFAVSDEDARSLSQAVSQYAEAFQAARWGAGTARSRSHTIAKDQAREEAERIIRRLAATIKANDRIDAASKSVLHLRERVKRLPTKMSQIAQGLTGPLEPPRLWFVRARHDTNSPQPMHELKFRSLDGMKAKAAGAARLELFVDLVHPDDPVPAHPGASLNISGGRPWYLRSYTRSPIVLVPPMARVPMRVVYWGRWADSCGGVGPFSKTVVAWVEGGTHHVSTPQCNRKVESMMPMLEDGAASQISQHQVQCRLMVLEAQYQSYVGAATPPHVMPALEAKEQETARLLGAA